MDAHEPNWENGINNWIRIKVLSSIYDTAIYWRVIR